MSNYSAPVRDMLFVIRELAGLDQINRLPGFEEATTDVVEAILEEAGRFSSEVLAPINQSGDLTGCRVVDGDVATPAGFADAYRQFVDGGWPSLPFAPELGGQGLPALVATAVNEVWLSANLAFTLCSMLTVGAVDAIKTHASDPLRSKFLPPLVAGRWTATMDLTEPQAGTDLAALTTRAQPAGDHYLITGQKIFITWGDQDFSENIIHLVLARLPDAPPGLGGISLFLVPKYLINDDGSAGERNDFRPISLEHKLGIKASPTCVMNFGEHGGATGYLVGEAHTGLACMFTMMNHARIGVGLQGLATTESAYQLALAYARERVQGKAPDRQGRVTIIHHPDVRRMLMLMKAGREAMRAFCYTTSTSLDYLEHATDKAVRQFHERRSALLTPVVKGWCTELAQELVSLGLQVHGGMGYIEETGAAQLLRDARITTIYEGTTGIQAKDLVGRKVLHDEGRGIRELLTEMRQTADSLPALEKFGYALAHSHYLDGIDQLGQALDWVLDNYAGDAHAPNAVCFNFLMLTGTLCGAWQMNRAALAASRRLAAGDGDAAFYRAKLATARFYGEHILPRADGYLQSILAGTHSIMALAEEEF